MGGFGEQLRRWRGAAGATRADIDAALQVAGLDPVERWCSQMENGQRAAPSPAACDVIARVCGVDPGVVRAAALRSLLSSEWFEWLEEHGAGEIGFLADRLAALDPEVLERVLGLCEALTRRREEG